VTCHIVDEPGALVLDNETIFTQSHHEDVDYHEHGLAKGLRSEGSAYRYDLPGHRRVRAFAGASRSCREFGAVSMSAASTSFQRDVLLLRTGRLLDALTGFEQVDSAGPVHGARQVHGARGEAKNAFPCINVTRRGTLSCKARSFSSVAACCRAAPATAAHPAAGTRPWRVELRPSSEP